MKTFIKMKNANILSSEGAKQTIGNISLSSKHSRNNNEDRHKE